MSGVLARLETLLRALRQPSADSPAALSEGTQPEAKPQPPIFSDLQASADRVRSAATWLIAIFGAIAGILVAGTQFSSIGSLPVGWRLTAAIVGASVALIGLTWLIWLLVEVMLPSQVALGEIAALARTSKRTGLVKYLERNPDVLAPYPNIRALERANRRARAREHRALSQYHGLLYRTGDESLPDVKKAAMRAQVANARAKQVDQTVGYVVKVLSVQQLRELLGIWRRVGVFTGALVVAVGIGVFAWAANPADDERSVARAALSGATLSGADLTGADLANADLKGAKLDDAVLVGANLKGADLSNADLSGADTRGATLEDVTWSNTTCPDGSNSDDHKSTCDGFFGSS